MSYEDFNPVVSLETVIKGNKVVEVLNPTWIEEDDSFEDEEEFEDDEEEEIDEEEEN